MATLIPIDDNQDQQMITLIPVDDNSSQQSEAKTLNDMRMKFVRDTAALPTRIKEEALNALPDRKTIAQFARPLLEGGGAVAGGMLATPETMGLGTLAGAGLGYSGGARIADMIEGKQRTLPDAINQSLQDTATGATYEMGGQLAGKALGKLVDFAKTPGKLPYTQAWSAKKASQVLNDKLPSGIIPDGDTQAVLSRIQTENIPTLAQFTNSKGAGILEQSLAAKNPNLASQFINNNAQINKDALSNLYRTVGESSPVMPSSKMGDIGNDIFTSINNAELPVKSMERQAWEQVPNYPMPTQYTNETIKAILSTPMVEDTNRAVKGIVDYLNQLPKTTQGMRAAESTITSEISKFSKAGDKNTSRVLGDIKSALQSDFNNLSDMAANGDIALYDGNIVYPSRLENEKAKLIERLNSFNTSATPNYEKMQAQLRDSGVHPAMYSKADARDMTWQDRTIQQYTSRISPEIPTMSNANPQEIANIKEGISAINNQLNNLQPADDVASIIKDAKNITIERNQRFNRGATKDVLRRGDEISGRNIANEDIPRQFWSESGAQDLIRAIGKDKAKETLLPYVQNNMATFTDNSGVLNVSRAMKWIKQNENILKTTGNHSDAIEIIKQQIPQSLKASIEGKAKTDIMGNPSLTAREGLKLVKEYMPAFKLAYGNDAAKYALALKDYQRTLSILSRNQNLSGGGSNTIDKLFGDATPDSLPGRIMSEVSGAILGGATGYGIAGGIGGATGAAAGQAITSATKAARAHSQETIRKLLTDAITNPESAKLLMDIGRGAKISPTKINNHLMTFGLITLSPNGEQ